MHDLIEEAYRIAENGRRTRKRHNEPEADTSISCAVCRDLAHAIRKARKDRGLLQPEFDL